MRFVNKRGQFIPIAAMVMFTTVVFLVAVANIYKVTRAKLKVQNLADAVALNIASQMASSMNKTSDLNEWMNHFIDQGPNVQPSKPGDTPNCSKLNPDLPPLSCVENTNKSTKLNMFSSLKNAQVYASLVQRINQSQDLFANTYNNFIGAGQSSNGSSLSNSSLQSILFNDIPELASNGTRVMVWNTTDGQTRAKNASEDTSGAAPKTSSLDTSGMKGLKYKTHDIMIGYWNEICVLGICHQANPQFRTLGDVLVGQEGKQTVVADPDKIGWKELDQSPNAPMITVDSAVNKVRFGAGSMVTRVVPVPIIGNVTVSGQAQAYVVEGSGTMGAQADMKTDPATGIKRPVFKPTFWVKLAGVQS